MKITSRPGDDLQNHLDAEFRQFCEDTHVMDWGDVQMAFGSLNVLLSEYAYMRTMSAQLRAEKDNAIKHYVLGAVELDRQKQAVAELLRDYSDTEQEEFWKSIDI